MAGADYAARVIEAARLGNKVVPVSSVIPDITGADSYEIQRTLVAAALDRGDAVAGYKGSFVTPGLKIGGVAVTPAIGVLLQAGNLAPGASISLGTFRHLVIECEIAFTFGQTVTALVDDVATLKDAVAAVRPAIELPDFALDGQMRTPADLIAINVAGSHQIFGAPVAADASLAGLAPTLSRDGTLIATGDVAATVGDPWETLLTLTNLTVSLGHEIAAGQTMLSGSIIIALDPAAGAYTADFGPLGAIDFTLVP